MESKTHVATGTYLMVWLALLLLTGMTITAAGLHFGRLSIMAAILIATVKGSLVLFIFMHLRDETVLFKIALMVALLTLTIIMVLTFADASLL